MCMWTTTSARGTTAATRFAPELFDVDDFGQAHEIGDGAVPAGLEDKAHLVVANCPEFAITIEESS